MKTIRLYSTILSLSLVIFASAGSIANPAGKTTGDVLKKNETKITTAEKGNRTEVNASAEVSELFSYLRFDVNAYTTESEVTEMPVSSFDYLRFDVTLYSESGDSEISELPVAIEFEKLRFDVKEYTESTGADSMEMPETDDFDYLRFDVDTYSAPGSSALDELPATE